METNQIGRILTGQQRVTELVEDKEEKKEEEFREQNWRKERGGRRRRRRIGGERKTLPVRRVHPSAVSAEHLVSLD